MARVAVNIVLWIVLPFPESAHHARISLVLHFQICADELAEKEAHLKALHVEIDKIKKQVSGAAS